VTPPARAAAHEAALTGTPGECVAKPFIPSPSAYYSVYTQGEQTPILCIQEAA